MNKYNIYVDGIYACTDMCESGDDALARFVANPRWARSQVTVAEGGAEPLPVF